MAIDLFRLMHGIEIENDVSGKSADILVGDNAPGGDAGVQDAAPIGTIYLRTNAEADGLQLYWKWSNANNSAADWKQSTDKAYVDAIAAGLSWREPVQAMDTTTTTLPTGTPTQTITVDGVTISDGDRVLFTSLTTPTDRNVWIYDQASGTFSEDPNAETDGDALLVQGGTYAEQQWVYDGTDWVQFGSTAGYAELEYLRTFVGKTGPGAELPTYSSIDVISQGDNLETAIGKLDAIIGTTTYTNDNVIADTDDITTSLDKIDTAIGNRTYTEDNYVTDGQTITASIDALDQALADINTQALELSGTNQAGPVVVDTLPVADATQAKWLIQVRETGTPANRRAVELHAFTDGTTVDHTTYSVLKLGANIAGFDVTVDINGTDMRLIVDANNNFDYVVKRVGYTAF